MSKLKTYMIWRGDKVRIAACNVWWWHSERGEACVTYYVGCFVILIATGKAGG